jgi:hypothetical protein
VLAPAAAQSVAITSGPPFSTTETSASFDWATSGKVNKVACALDGGHFVPCSSPKTVSASPIPPLN